jgi:hypothetical protein
MILQSHRTPSMISMMLSQCPISYASDHSRTCLLCFFNKRYISPFSFAVYYKKIACLLCYAFKQFSALSENSLFVQIKWRMHACASSEYSSCIMFFVCMARRELSDQVYLSHIMLSSNSLNKVSDTCLGSRHSRWLMVTQVFRFSVTTPSYQLTCVLVHTYIECMQM